jgi:hypothetical protein
MAADDPVLSKAPQLADARWHEPMYNEGGTRLPPTRQGGLYR